MMLPYRDLNLMGESFRSGLAFAIELGKVLAKMTSLIQK